MTEDNDPRQDNTPQDEQRESQDLAGETEVQVAAERNGEEQQETTGVPTTDNVDQPSALEPEDIPHEPENPATEADPSERGPEDSVKAPTEVSVAEVEGEPQGEYLDEAFFPATSSDSVLQVGSQHVWGNVAFTVEEALAKGWYRGRKEGTDEAVLLRPEAREAFWGRLPRHPLLPRALHSGPEGYLLSYLEGEPLSLPLPLGEALAYTAVLAQLVRFFEAQGLAVVNIEPEALVLTASGLRLRYPPHLAPIGETLPQLYREGNLPPEVQAGVRASGKEGVYLLGALLLHLVRGEVLPPEGPSLLLLAGTKAPGLPQLLAAALAAPPKRLSPQAFVDAVKALREQSKDAPTFHIGATTTVGLNPDRPVNEDAFGYVHQLIHTYAGPAQLLRACVADGMGGEASGEVASRAAVEAFCTAPPPHPLDAAQAQAEWAVQLVWQANEAVLAALSGQDGGCTFTAAVLVGSRLSLAHVGDTRAYRFNATGLVPITKDHSLVSAMVASGMMTEVEAETSPDRNKVLRSLGSVRHRQDNYVDGLSAVMAGSTLELAPGEAVLMVSDGVWGEVEDARIAEILEADFADPQAVADKLVAEALEAGAPDNATALVVVRVAKPAASADSTEAVV